MATINSQQTVQLAALLYKIAALLAPAVADIVAENLKSADTVSADTDALTDSEIKAANDFLASLPK